MGRGGLGAGIVLAGLLLAGPVRAATEDFLLVSVQIQGAQRFAAPALEDVLGLAPGSRFTLATLRAGLLRLEELGLFAELRPRLEAGPLGGAHLTVEVTEWPMIQAVRLRGLSRTQEQVVRRELTLGPGAMLSRAALQADQERLGRLGYFARITPGLERVPAGYDLVWTLEERSTGRVHAAAGWSSVDGPLASLALSQDNFLGGGQRLGASLTVGRLMDPARRNLSTELSYQEPWLDDRHTSLGGEAYLRREYRPWAPLEDGRSGYQDERLGAGLSVGRPLGEARSSTWALRGRLRGEQVAIAHLDATGAREPVGVATLSGSGRDWALVAGIGLEQDCRDDAVAPARGWRLALALDQHLPVTLSRTTRATMSYGQYGRLPWGWIVALGLRGGAVTDLGGGRVPFYERFQAVGEQAVRGWREGEASGNGMALGSLELRVPLLGPVGLVGFGDAGWFWSPSEAGEQLRALRTGYGAGLRVQTPLGLMRVDCGLPRWGAAGIWSVGIGQRF